VLAGGGKGGGGTTTGGGGGGIEGRIIVLVIIDIDVNIKLLMSTATATAAATATAVELKAVESRTSVGSAEEGGRECSPQRVGNIKNVNLKHYGCIFL
jgi:hypothetical protein